MKSVDDGWTEDGRADGEACLYYKLIYEPKGSNEQMIIIITIIIIIIIIIIIACILIYLVRWSGISKSNAVKINTVYFTSSFNSSFSTSKGPYTKYEHRRQIRMRN